MYLIVLEIKLCKIWVSFVWLVNSGINLFGGMKFKFILLFFINGFSVECSLENKFMILNWLYIILIFLDLILVKFSRLFIIFVILIVLFIIRLICLFCFLVRFLFICCRSRFVNVWIEFKGVLNLWFMLDRNFDFCVFVCCKNFVFLFSLV